MIDKIRSLQLRKSSFRFSTSEGLRHFLKKCKVCHGLHNLTYCHAGTSQSSIRNSNCRPVHSFLNDLCQRAFEGLFDEESGHATKAFRKELQKWLRKKEIDEGLLDFSLFAFLHLFAHLLYEYIVDRLQTDYDNIAYHIDRQACSVYLIENAEKGLGLTEVIAHSIREEGGKEFFIRFLEWSLQIIELVVSLVFEFGLSFGQL